MPGFALHPVTQKAVMKLKEGKPGDTYTEDQIEQWLGVECRPNTVGKTRIGKAINICMREHRVQWKWIIDKKQDTRTLQCLGSVEILEKCMDRERRHLFRTSKKVQRQSLCIKEGDLNEEQTRRYKAYQVNSLMTEHIHSTKFLQKLTDNGSAKLRAPDMPALIALMQQ